MTTIQFQVPFKPVFYPNLFSLLLSLTLSQLHHLFITSLIDSFSCSQLCSSGPPCVIGFFLCIYKTYVHVHKHSTR